MMSDEQHDTDVKLEHFDPQPYLSIRTTIAIAGLGEAMGERTRALSDYLQHHGISAAGPPFVRYFTFGDSETDFEFGIPVAEPAAGEGWIAAGALPGGPAITTWHIGAHDRLGEAYARVAAGLKSYDLQAGGPAREVYYWLDLGRQDGSVGMPDAATWRTQLIQPVTEA